MNYPAKYTVHKGQMGAFQLSIILPTWEESQGEKSLNKKVVKEGSLLIEMAPFLKEENGNKYYNWKEAKVSFGLGLSDIASILNSQGGECKLIHINEISNKTKNLTISPGTDKYVGTYKVALYEKDSTGKTQSSLIAFSAGEWQVFITLMKYSIPLLLGWE